MSRPRAARRLPLPLLAAFGAFSATAQTPPAAVSTLPEVRIKAGSERETATSPVIGYKARNAVTATKTDTPLILTPQSVTVVTRDQMADQGATGLQEALNYAAGVRSDAYGVDSRSDNVRIRGSYPEIYQDGLRRRFDWYTSDTRADPFTLERVEVLRGPSSMLFGQSTTGGVVNMVSKRPRAQFQGEVGVQVGSYGRKQLRADLTGPLSADGEWLYRLVAVGRKADTQVDYVSDDRALFMPSLTWQPSAATSLTLQGLWQQDKSGSTAQFFPWEGVSLPNPNGKIPTNRFIGEPGFDRYDSGRKSIGWLFEHRFNDQVAVRQNVRYSHNRVDYYSIYGDAFSGAVSWQGDPINKRVLGRYVDVSETTAKLLATDQHAEIDFTTGAAKHKLLAGLDAAHYTKDVRSFFDVPDYLGGTAPPIDVYDPVYQGYVLPGPLVDQPRSGVRQAALYLQDQLRVGNWIVIAGLRRDRAVATLESEPDDKVYATTRRLGLLYAFAGGWSPYLSYSESFLPQAPRTVAGRPQRLTPLFGEQFEAGLKYEPAGGNLAGSAALYTLKEKNNVVDLGTSITQAGITRNKGLELELKGRITPALEIASHYNYTDVDRALEQLPKHQASVWGKYRFAIAGLPGFSAGAGVRYMSAFRDGPAPETPSVTLVDLMLAYETSSWRYALNINNAADREYVGTCLSRGDCWYGARRNIVASATYQF
ncbi:MAG: TonB-dependent siderophore receptor [Ramlibacter sp.]|nr:TonB-dependent siderophore receptor [Ramlibacter sp.]